MNRILEAMGNYLPATKSRTTFLELRPTIETVHEQLSAFNYKLLRNVLLHEDVTVILRSLHQCHGQFASLLSSTSVVLNRREREGIRHNKQMMGMLIDLMEGRGQLSTANMTAAFPTSMLMSSGGRPLYESVDDTTAEEAQPWIQTPGGTLNYQSSTNRQVTFADDVGDKLNDLPSVPLSHTEELDNSTDTTKETDGLLPASDTKTPLPTIVPDSSEGSGTENDKGWVKVGEAEDKVYANRPQETPKEEHEEDPKEMVVHEASKHEVSVPVSQGQTHSHITYTSTVASLGGSNNQQQDMLQQVAVVLEGVRTVLRWVDVKLEQRFMVAQSVAYTRSVLLLIAFISCAICVAWPAIGMLVIAFIFVALTVLVDVADQLFLSKSDPDRMLRDSGPKKIRPCQMV